MSKHTPGPWELCDNYDEVIICRKKESAGTYIGVVCEMTIYDKQDRANAHLIASAPELLEACKDYAYKYFSRAGDDLERLTPEARRILKAIAKAEGN